MPMRRLRGDRPAFDRRRRVTVRFGTPLDPAGFADPAQFLEQLRERIEQLRAASEPG
jgi:1-acyl-sn-glycerol-3-phosphate acyltransferase